MHVDPVGVLEAAYAVHLPEQEWLQGVTDAARPALDRGRGLTASIYDASQPAKLQVSRSAGSGMPKVGVHLVRLGAQTAGTSIISRVRWESCAMLSELVSRDELRNIPLLKMARLTFGVRDLLGLNASDPTLKGVAFCAPSDRLGPDLAPGFKNTWSHVAAHVCAGLRLRRQVEGAASLADGAEAILEPGGKVQHAKGEATGKAERLALRGASIGLDRARTVKQRRQDPDEALRLWRALVQGRWSLVDHFEKDGRRYLVARRNDPLLDGQRLSLRERQVVAFACLGHTNKLIAYELGLSISRVASTLGAAMRKLGAKSRIELIRLVEGRQL